MERYVDRNRLHSHVRFFGARPNSFVRELIAASDVLFLPSAHEGISLSLYEAMAAGVPVVGADVGGQSELVTPECGVLVKRADKETEVTEYCDALAELLVDQGRREAMGKAGRARIRAHFTLEEMGDRMEAVLARAGELARSDRRAVPSAEEARNAAREGVRVVWWDYPLPPSRFREAAESSFARSYPVRQALLRAWRTPGGYTTSYQVRYTLFRALRTVGMPIYDIGMRLGLHWLEPLKDRVFAALFRQGK
jgi:hypothetical protein